MLAGMSGSAWHIPIVPIPGSRCATIDSVHREVRRWLRRAWETFPDFTATWCHDRSITFGTDHPDHPIYVDEEPEEVEWLAEGAPDVIDVWIHNEGYWPSDLGEHWRELALMERVGFDILLRRLGYRRAPAALGEGRAPAFPHPGDVLYRSVPGGFRAPLFYVIDGVHHRLGDEGLEPHCDASGNLAEGDPIALASLPEEVRERIEAQIAREECGCAGCAAVTFDTEWTRPEQLTTRPGWRAQTIDSWGRSGIYLPFPDGVRINVAVSTLPEEYLGDIPPTMLHRSRNGGLDWEYVVAPTIEPIYVFDAAGVQRDGMIVLHAAGSTWEEHEQGKVRWLSSEDLGETWAGGRGIPVEGPLQEVSFFSSPFRRGEMVVAVVDAGGACRLHHTEDGGVRWTSSNALVHEGQPVVEMRSVCFSPESAARLTLVVRVPGDAPDAAVASDDGGRTFRALATPGIDPEIVMIGHGGVRCVVGGALPARESDVVARSEDGGATWKEVARFPCKEPSKGWVSGRGLFFLMTQNPKSVYRCLLLVSEDEGAAWSVVADDLGFHRPHDDPDDPDAFLLGRGEEFVIRLSRTTAARRPRD